MTPTPSGKRKMILDVDTGIDDALALAYLASFDDIEILGVIGLCTGTVGVPGRSGDVRLDAPLLGGRVHSRRRLRAVPRHGWIGRIRPVR